MVLADKIGKERPFGIVVLLYVVTFGIYGIYWHYKAHDEVFKQFELQGEGRDQGIIWLILGYVLFRPLLYVYLWMFVSNVQDIRQRLSFTDNLSPGKFLALTISAVVVNFIGTIVFFVFYIRAILGLDENATGEETSEALIEALLTALPIMVVAWLIAAGLQLFAYGRLQSDLNGLWRAYDQRVDALD